VGTAKDPAFRALHNQLDELDLRTPCHGPKVVKGTELSPDPAKMENNEPTPGERAGVSRDRRSDLANSVGLCFLDRALLMTFRRFSACFWHGGSRAVRYANKSPTVIRPGCAACESKCLGTDVIAEEIEQLLER
jgi:hypothetical protein